MKLYYSDASPFARKNRIAARELGLIDRIKEISLAPMKNPPELVAANPIVQVPTLILDDGRVVIGSPLINAYLCDAAKSEKIYGNSVLESKRIEFLADGTAEMLVKTAFENVRPEEYRSAAFLQRWHDNARRGFEFLDKELLNADYNIGSIAAVVALSYGLFRIPQIIEGLELPNLYKLRSDYEGNENFKATAPQ